TNNSPPDMAVVRSRPGLVDMLIDYRHSLASSQSSVGPLVPAEGSPTEELQRAEHLQPIPSLSQYLVPIQPKDTDGLFGGDGTLSLLPAGKRDEHPLGGAPSSGEDEFYASNPGKHFFEAFRRELSQIADVVLIDAPTGQGFDAMSEVGRASTRLLSDVVVCFCGAGDDDIEATDRLVEQLQSAETLVARDHRPLETIVVPAGVDDSRSENIGGFQQRFARLTESRPLPAPWREQHLEFWDLRIPDVAQSVSDGSLSIREGEGPATSDPLARAYWTLARSLSLLAPAEHPVHRQFARLEERARALGEEPSQSASKDEAEASVEPTEQASTTSEVEPPTPTESVELAAPDHAAPQEPEPAAAQEPEALEPPMARDEMMAVLFARTSFHTFEALGEIVDDGEGSATKSAESETASDVEASTSADVEAKGPVAETIPPPSYADESVSSAALSPAMDEVVEIPKSAPLPSIAGPSFAPVAKPSIPPVTAHKGGARRAPGWGSSVALLSAVAFGIVVYFATRGSDNNGVADNRTAPSTKQAPAAPIPQGVPSPTPQPAALEPAALEPAAPEPANAANVDHEKSLPAVADRHDPNGPGGRYLRVGRGPSCPRILNYRRQFLASGMSDAKAVLLKSGGCALVLGPYPADAAEERRKEHNARHIRGFDTAVVVDDSDFEKWL
ncbi:MAG TPA: hypothetical protein VGL13_11145, partial [Polyangiaceae bacterium]